MFVLFLSFKFSSLSWVREKELGKVCPLLFNWTTQSVDVYKLSSGKAMAKTSY